MYTKAKLTTKQMKPLIPSSVDRNRFHNLYDECLHMLVFLGQTKDVIKRMPLGERVQKITDLLQQKYPHCFLTVEPRSEDGEAFYTLKFSNLFDTNMVLVNEKEQKISLSDTSIIYLGSFLDYQDGELTAWNGKGVENHAIIIDYNGNEFYFESWVECLQLFDQKYSNEPVILASASAYIPKIGELEVAKVQDVEAEIQKWVLYFKTLFPENEVYLEHRHSYSAWALFHIQINKLYIDPQAIGMVNADDLFENIDDDYLVTGISPRISFRTDGGWNFEIYGAHDYIIEKNYTTFDLLLEDFMKICTTTPIPIAPQK
jgi:uncharacterized protein YrzB (UPF0473 family)